MVASLMPTPGILLVYPRERHLYATIVINSSAASSVDENATCNGKVVNSDSVFELGKAHRCIFGKDALCLKSHNRVNAFTHSDGLSLTKDA